MTADVWSGTESPSSDSTGYDLDTNLLGDIFEISGYEHSDMSESESESSSCSSHGHASMGFATETAEPQHWANELRPSECLAWAPTTQPPWCFDCVP